MKYLFLSVLIWGGLSAQTAESKQSLHATISNLDKEPTPYVPDPTLRPSTYREPSLAERRRASAPGMTLGEIEDRKELIRGLADSGALVVIPVVIGR